MIETAIACFERRVIADITKTVGRRITSAQLAAVLQDSVSARMAKGEISRELLTLMRLTIKATPYSPDVAVMLEIESQLLRAWAMPRMPGVIDIIKRCVANKVPVPLIVSCRKYIEKARDAQGVIAPRYFGIQPIILQGDVGATEEHAEGSELRLPSCDSYEALPAKVFDAVAFFAGLGATYGILKIDDDVRACDSPALRADDLVQTLAGVDYAGRVLDRPEHDRSWHVGKCLTPVSITYGKPYRNPWANGPLYYLSGRALSLLAHHYLRFPGLLGGELYEDKAIGDVLYSLGIPVRACPLDAVLGLSTDAPERLLAAAE